LRQAGPAGVVIGDASTVIVRDIDRFRSRGKRCEAKQGDEYEMSGLHRLFSC
jgi:hypothetical protein